MWFEYLVWLSHWTITQQNLLTCVLKSMWIKSAAYSNFTISFSKDIIINKYINFSSLPALVRYNYK